MLRYMFRLHRHKDDQWIDNVTRAANDVDDLAQKYSMRDWVMEHRRRMLDFAGKTARRTDNRWSKKMLGWVPNYGHGRSRGHPFTRWSADLIAFAGGNWIEHAKNEKLWTSLVDGFMKKLHL